VTTRSYRPSNGTEGIGFMERFCDRCEKDFLYRKTDDGRDGCPIAAAAFLYGIDEPEYPKEWVENEGPWETADPRCTAFEEKLTEDARFHRAAEAAGQKRLFE
jgi:hypothetical protein